MSGEYAKGFLLTALGVAVLSFDALLIRKIGVEAFDLLFWRGALMALVIFVWYRWRTPERPLFSMDAAYWRSALLFGGSAVCFVTAMMMTSVVNVLVIVSAQPLFAALMSRIFLGARVSLLTWFAIVLSMAGIAWVLLGSHQSDEGQLIGDLIALMCSLCLSAKFVNDRAVSHRDMTPALILSGVLVAVISVIAGEPFSLQGEAWGWMLLMCLGLVPIAFILITLGPMRIPAADVGMLMLLETALGPLWVWLWLDEAPSLSAVQGGVLVVVTLLAHGFIQGWRQRHRKAARH